MDDFHRSKHRKDGRKGDCKSCRSRIGKNDPSHWKDRYARQRAFMNSLKTNPCDDCGEEYHPEVMQFHHLFDKTIEVAKLVNRSEDVILAEVAKCVLLCANCHIMRHVNEKESRLVLG